MNALRQNTAILLMPINTVSVFSYSPVRLFDSILSLFSEEENMMSWLNAMHVHDFTGERAKAQWDQWQEEKKVASKRKLEEKPDDRVPDKVPKE